MLRSRASGEQRFHLNAREGAVALQKHPLQDHLPEEALPMAAGGPQAGVGLEHQLCQTFATEITFCMISLLTPHPFFSSTISPVFRIQMIHFWNVFVLFKCTLWTSCWLVQMQGLKVSWQGQMKRFLIVCLGALSDPAEGILPALGAR